MKAPDVWLELEAQDKESGDDSIAEPANLIVDVL
jgi:hypothetical protein